MASQAATPPLPVPPQIAKALAGAAPPELSHRPLLRTVGVGMGARIVTPRPAGRKRRLLERLALCQLSAGLYPHSPGLPAARGRTAGAARARIRLQAFPLSIADGFLLDAWGCVVAPLLIAMPCPSPLRFRPVGFQGEVPASPKDHS